MGTATRADFGSGTTSSSTDKDDNDNNNNNNNNNRADEDDYNRGPPSKLRRTNKACIQCRVRKQRCDGLSPKTPTASCSRCIHLGVECSFTTSPVDNTSSIDSDAQATNVAKTAYALERLQKRVAEQEGRLQRLERITSSGLDAGSVTTAVKECRSRLALEKTGIEVFRQDSEYNLSDRVAEPKSIASAHVAHPDYDIHSPRATTTTTAHNQPIQGHHHHHAALDAVHLDTPMSTLRHLQQYDYDADQTRAIHDPISCGLITMTEAQEAFDLYFSSCHKWAPVLCPRTQKSAATVRLECPTLFTSICAVAFRFMDHHHHHPFPSAAGGGVPQHREIVKILDVSLSRLLLKPDSSDVHLGHIQALLLYVQWMPVDVQNGGKTKDRLRTRYNDVSAWSMLGLAIRYALFLGLQDSPSAFLPERQASATIEDLARLRVWINLLTNDANLMLSSGLPASLNPEPVALVSQTFASHRDASQPEDMRVAALCELVAILKHAARSSGSPNVRALDAFSLRRANLEFNAWEVHWNHALGPELMHNQMPFTALRAYRLTVNSSCLSTLLARPAPESSSSTLSSSNTGSIPLHSLEALDVSLTAACQTILALSEQATWETWSTHSSIASIPRGRLSVNRTAVERISFSVDSSWVSHSFAAVFLVLCFARRAIDDDLNILALAGSSSSSSLLTTSRYPSRPRPESLLSRLITLAAEIFNMICSRHPLAHPATGYQTLLDAVFSPLLDIGCRGSGDGDEEDIRDVELQAAQGIEMYLDEFFESMVNNNPPYLGIGTDLT